MLQLLGALSTRQRQDLEQRLQEAPLRELAQALADRRLQAAERHLAAVVLSQRFQRDQQRDPSGCESSEWLLEGLLKLLEEEEELQVLRAVADCVARVADTLAQKGRVWQELLMWMRSVEKCSLHRRAFLYLLERLLESGPWRDLLEPHVLQIAELLCCIAQEGKACAKHAFECIGSLAVVARGEETARFFHQEIVRPLLVRAKLPGELGDSALEALSRAAAVDELLIADSSFYTDLAPQELCPVVLLALEAAQQRERRSLALQLLYSVADSHSRLLCTSRGGQLSAEDVLQVLLRVAADEAPEEWGPLFTLLARMSKRMPDKLVLPVIYRSACRSLCQDAAQKLGVLASLRAVLLGCTASVKKQLPRIARLVLRALNDPQLHPVTFVLIADLCVLVPPEARCGSCRLAERLLPPLLQQLQRMNLCDPAFPGALAALEAACPRGRLASLPQSSLAVAWTTQKLEELLSQPSADAAVCARLLGLLAALLQRSLEKSLKQRVAMLLQKLLLSNSAECKAMALEAAGALQPLLDRRQELYAISLHVAERGLREEELVTAAVRWWARVQAPAPQAAFGAGLERCVSNPSPALLQALALLLASAQCLPSLQPDDWARLSHVLLRFLELPELRGPAADVVRQLPLTASTAPLLPCLAYLLEVEDRPSVFCSLCTAAAHLAVQETDLPQEGLQMLRAVASSLRQRGARDADSEEPSSASEYESCSEHSAPTVASTADLETAGPHHALHSLCLALGLAP